MKLKTLMGAIAIAATLAAIPTKQAVAGSTPYIGEVMWVGFTFCPRGWANADGQLIPIAQNNALFSLYGTTYGGDGRTTFALPDLRGRVPVHTKVSSYQQGSKGGKSQVTLTTPEIPEHNHLINASQGNVHKNPKGRILGRARDNFYDARQNATVTLDDIAVSYAGGNSPHENRPPYLTLRACVALAGEYPSRP